MEDGLSAVSAAPVAPAAPAAVVSDGASSHSMLLVRVHADRIEVNEHFTQDRTLALFRALQRLGVSGEIIFRTPCG